MKGNYISTILKGFIVGSTMMVPGISGGSMAMILNIYNKLIRAINTLTKNLKENIIFLMVFVFGAGVGILLCAKPLSELIERYYMPMHYLFLGVAAGGVPMMYREAKVKKFSWKQPLYIIIGILAVVLFTYIPLGQTGGMISGGIVEFLWLLFTGIVLAVGLVLPGISISYLLLLMGIHDKAMIAISELDIMFLLPLAVGLILGVLLVTKFLDNAMTKYPQVTYLIILGFILGSLAELFPGIPTGLDWLFCIAALVAGFMIIQILLRLEEKMKNETTVIEDSVE